MTALWPRIFLLGSALGVSVSLFLVSQAVDLKELAPPELIKANVNVKVQYEDQLEPIELSLRSVVERPLTLADKEEFSRLRTRLMALTVPAEAKEFHLALVLKVQQLEDMLSQVSSVQNAPWETVQAELRTLVVNHQW